MISIKYNNPEVESLMQGSKSTRYKEISGKRMFLKALQAFPNLLRILCNTQELLMYKQYQYKRSVNVSYVLISGSNIQRRLLFSEQEQGTSIIINDLIL